MTIRVFHLGSADELAPGREVQLSAEESHYLVRVRRARPGEWLEVLDGTTAHGARVSSTQSRAAVVTIVEPLAHPAVPVIELGLCIVDPKAVLEALTLTSEIGVHTVSLLRSTHAQTAVPSRERIDKVLMAAQRQCGRPRRPTVRDPLPLSSWLGRDDHRPGFVATTSEGEPPGPGRRLPAGARVLVGPEGGLSLEEVAEAKAAGFQPISLGPWILRTPTAAALAVGLMLGEG